MLLKTLAIGLFAVLATALPTSSLDKRANVAVTSSSNLVKYANYAAAAYNNHKVNTWNCKVACKQKATAGTKVAGYWDYPSVGNKGYIAVNSKTKEIIVAYRGTKTALGWVTNVQATKDNWPSGVKGSEVHSGFLKAYKKSQKFVRKSIDKLAKKYPTYKVVFVGHSLGGALASLTAADVAKSTPELTERMHLYTYGQPRVGTQEFASWMNKRGFPIYRVTYKQDAVPHSPPLAMGFRHFNQEVWYNLAGDIKWCGATTENKKCQNSVKPQDFSKDDHSKYPGFEY
ncbi:alpha/beta-hydrolase [Linderina pennispora]|uniref:Alpha/beta-hydrolase n=1 Tax=Linderina pennispora TaxID=61395 RepID=A0A1Y1W3H2_9FUNG|nr:alpha/beta-hydrolase [Linderina pennispora]ORX67845.1 alpha/beta-hydrolase [Linderina pennispora]